MLHKQQMDKYFEEFISVVIKSKAHLEVFLKQVEDMSNEDKEYLRDLWEIETLNVPEEEKEEDLEEMSKDELEEYALEEFNVDIDRRKNISTLLEEVIELKSKE